MAQKHLARLSARTLGTDARSAFRVAIENAGMVGSAHKSHNDAVRELVRRAKLGDAVLSIHQMLYPERYPRSVQPDHVYWTSGEPAECFEWDSETIEWVAGALQRALKDDPRAVLVEP